MKINYVTGNKGKLEFAQKFLTENGFEVVQKIPEKEILEIQSQDYLEIAIDKAKKAYEQIKQPLFVTDTSWEIPALNGFPGAFMSYVNKWFTEQDFLNLMESKSDRSVFCFDNIVYIDEKEIKTFQIKFKGEIAKVPKGNSKNSFHNIVLFDNMYLCDYSEQNKYIKDETKVWGDFVEFLKNKN